MHRFAEYLTTRLREPLPGFEAQSRMAPRFPNGRLRSFEAPPTAKKSAVLALLHIHNETLSLFFTLRSAGLTNHKGQISFPGGRMDGGESTVQTALRETREETGIAESGIAILGSLSQLYTPPSNSAIHPVVGWMPELPDLQINPDEVDECFSVGLDALHSPANISEEEWNYNGTPMTVPLWRVHPAVPLWGATAIIVGELTYLYGEWLGVGGA
ncbi:MAG: CoA pyrophosphatase [Candidatus Kapabacteria bacterium]|nr:CoA pyrophosphatase [Candidatus Kapabacteria bacterium]